MPKALESVTHEALELPRDRQLQLAHYVFSREDVPFGPAIKQAWEDEICALMEAVREGTAKLIPWAEARTRMHERLRECSWVGLKP